jgi:signal transduction histidine kinase
MDEERAAALLGQGLFATLSNPVIGGIAAAAMLPAVATAPTLVWLGLVTIVTAGRAALWGCWRLRPALLPARGWLVGFTLGGTLNGLAWGSMALLMWPGDTAHRALIGFVVGGMVASSSAVVPAFVPAFYTFTVAALLPPIVRFALAGGPVDLTMGLLLTTFGLAMSKFARNAGRWFVQNTELRLRNADLVANLSEARDGLEARVKERTTELERTIEQLRQAEGRAQDALRDREEFLAVASHELRTPIATLELHLSQLAMDTQAPGRATAKTPANLALMHRQLRRLTGLVDTVLTVAGVKARHLTPPSGAECDLPTLVRTVVADLTTHATRQPEITLDLEEPLRGAWDPVRLEQVVSNLVSNALKYGGGSPVEIRLAADGGDVVLTVADHGPGIAATDLARVFERFYRAPAGAHEGGLGLGLAVVRELVETMGGHVSVSSPPGQGASFEVRLPLTPVAAVPSAGQGGRTQKA